MAEEAFQNDLEKSEEPTPRRREEARRKGQFARSKNLVPAATLAATAVALRFGGEELTARIGRCAVAFFELAGTWKPATGEELSALAVETGLLLAPALLPVLGAGLLAGLGSGFLQSGFVLAAEPLKLDWTRINAAAGFRRLLSLEAAVELVKAIILIGALGTLGGAYLYYGIPSLAALAGFRAAEVFSYASTEGARLTAWVAGAMAALAGLDYLYQRRRTEARLRMSREEIKEELREQEGDPQLKGRLKGLRQKMARRRMSAEVAKADVVVTNPTELAVALRYRSSDMAAPRVVGKGAGFLAAKIREIARANGIPIVENKPLARLLYQRVEVGREIPETLYRAVAEVLAYVYGLRARKAAARAGSGPAARR
ncbi:MAG TPA: EscU/YscU/HrcU family type III secretion system export apparatus switch protein [candidate division Zixibacteria bacterium]|nr:EscU/YscU/HrcU family type III secretion system export apparatus switch protein [candidate division Zixibacteria bacterium]